MNGLQLQLPTHQQVAGAVQMPLVLLVWCALLLFFGYQYQANALLPKADALASQDSLGADELLRLQQRNDRLLAELAAQAPAQLPQLLDQQVFGQDLARELAGTELARGEWQPEAAVAQATQAVTKLERAAKVESREVAPSKPVAPEVKVKVAAKVQVKAKVASEKKAAKFVRLPAVVNNPEAMQANPLRESKSRARADLEAGRVVAAYQRLRGKVAQGRTDIEFLGLLALASLQHQPQEAQVLYQHLMQLQPDAKRWRQGLEHTEQILALQGQGLQTANPSVATAAASAPVAG